MLDQVWPQAAAAGLKVAGGLLVFVLFWLGGVLLRKLLQRISQRLEEGPRSAVSIFGQIGKSALILLGLLTALGTIGINISALVAGLGLTGFALGFALKDALSNFLAGMLLLIYQPFHIGDRIAVAGHEGEVISIDLRYTTLLSQGNRILIPNATLFTNAIRVLEEKSV